MTNVKAIHAVFDAAFGNAADLASVLFSEGIGDRVTAKPYALEWAAAKYGVRPVRGQRGMMLARGTPACNAANYVLGVCFPTESSKKSGSDKPKTPGQLFEVYVTAMKGKGLRYSTALKALNEAYGI